MLTAVAALVGLWLFDRERRRSHLPEQTIDAAVAGVIGGLAGAKLVWTIEHLGREGTLLELLFSRGGFSWYGGFAGGVTAGVVLLRRHRIAIVPVLAAATPALAVAHAIGRVGCFLVGDDYGVPSDLPWAVAFPQGLPPTEVPVHPTQLYEMLALLPVAWMLLSMRRHGRPNAFVLGAYLASAGLVRFGVEFLRVRQPLLGPLAPAHLFALVAIGVGLALIWQGRSVEQREAMTDSGDGRDTPDG